ncbi:MAG: DUF2092 domain-containing protein [Pseudomonadota bacterium]
MRMRRATHRQMASLCFGLAIALTVGTLAAPAAAQEPVAPETLLRRMASTMIGADTIAVTVEELSDRVGSDGQKVLVAGEATIRVSRPDRLLAKAVYDGRRIDTGYAGSDLLLLDHDRATYGTYPVSGPISAALEVVSERFRAFAPVTELLSDGVLEKIQRDVVVMRDLGEKPVQGTTARHLLLLGTTRDVQLWIRVEEPVLPLRMVVTDVSVAKQPQRIFHLTEWRLGVEMAPEGLELRIPEGYRREEIRTLDPLE